MPRAPQGAVGINSSPAWALHRVRMWDSSRWMEIQARQGKPHNAAPLRASVSLLFCQEAEEEGR